MQEPSRGDDVSTNLANYRTECPGYEAVAGLGGGCGASSQRCEYTDNKGDNEVSLNREKLSKANDRDYHLLICGI